MSPVTWKARDWPADDAGHMLLTSIISHARYLLLTQSDYTRSQSAGQLVQQKVSEELAKVQYQAQEALALAKKNLEQAEKNEVAETDSVSSSDLAAKFEALKTKFETSTYVTELDKETNSVRETLVKCLQDNKGRPLDCYEEVEQFKAKLRTLA